MVNSHMPQIRSAIGFNNLSGRNSALPASDGKTVRETINQTSQLGSGDYSFKRQRGYGNKTIPGDFNSSRGWDALTRQEDTIVSREMLYNNPIPAKKIGAKSETITIDDSDDDVTTPGTTTSSISNTITKDDTKAEKWNNSRTTKSRILPSLERPIVPIPIIDIGNGNEPVRKKSKLSRTERRRQATSQSQGSHTPKSGSTANDIRETPEAEQAQDDSPQEGPGLRSFDESPPQKRHAPTTSRYWPTRAASKEPGETVTVDNKEDCMHQSQEDVCASSYKDSAYPASSHIGPYVQEVIERDTPPERSTQPISKMQSLKARMFSPSRKSQEYLHEADELQTTEPVKPQKRKDGMQTHNSTTQKLQSKPRSDGPRAMPPQASDLSPTPFSSRNVTTAASNEGKTRHVGNEEKVFALDHFIRGYNEYKRAPDDHVATLAAEGDAFQVRVNGKSLAGDLGFKMSKITRIQYADNGLALQLAKELSEPGNMNSKVLIRLPLRSGRQSSSHEGLLQYLRDNGKCIKISPIEP
jgi:hypothetical protein